MSVKNFDKNDLDLGVRLVAEPEDNATQSRLPLGCLAGPAARREWPLELAMRSPKIPDG